MGEKKIYFDDYEMIYPRLTTFHYFLNSSDKYINDKYWSNLFLSTHPGFFFKLTE